ncbi:MAG TPA: DUF711 family protein [Terriglobia bacterium]|nr:DUF711 family protein [Terriglobia bacterium]
MKLRSSRGLHVEQAALTLAFVLPLLVCAQASVIAQPRPSGAGEDAAQKASTVKPKIRAVTAFVRLDPARYQAEIRDTLIVLRQAKAIFEQAGYEVQSIRITTQPFPEYTHGMSHKDALAFFHAYDALAHKEGFDAAIGPAMLKDDDDPAPARLLGEVLAEATTLEGSLAVAGDDGIHWRAVYAAARLVKYVSLHSAHSQGNFSFAATALVPPLTPFYPGSYHLGRGHEFAVALESANVVADVFSSVHDPSKARVALRDALAVHARAIENAARQVQKQTGWTYEGIDLSPAPLKEVSIGEAIEKFTGARVGAPGTMTAAAVITGALHDVPVKHAGYSGLMLPILEDSVLADRWSQGAINMDALLAYSAVCGTGLDVIPLPGRITEDELARIIGDMATLAVKWHKPLSARLLPVAGKKAGDQTEFQDPFLVNATIRDVGP